ncbi:hypothetical protein PAPHI01_2474 [Pancytospora philotis]|nr:hypothetical protein PAPHI01_2474 [Pancytospora philotis]
MRILKNAEIIYSANGRIVQQFCEEMQFAQTSRTGDDLFEAWRSKYYPLLKYKLESACWSISGDEIRKLVTTACRILRNGTKLESEDLIERQCAFSSLSSSVLSSFVSYYYAWMIFEIHTGLTGIAAQSQRKALASVESMLLIFEYVFVR